MADAAQALRSGRTSYARSAWSDAHASLTQADELAGLGATDLELLGTAAFMLGREDEFVKLLERAHHAHLQDDEPLRAVRCAFWLAAHLSVQGDLSVASGWLGRAERLLEDQEDDCVEHGYLLIPVMFRREASGDFAAAAATAGDAAEFGRRFGDPDLCCARDPCAGTDADQRRARRARASHSSTRRWSASPEETSRRWSAASSIAA